MVASAVAVPPARTEKASSAPLGETVTVTVLVDVLPEPSAAVYVNWSVPEKPFAGVYVKLPSAEVVTVPCAGAPADCSSGPSRSRCRAHRQRRLQLRPDRGL